MTDNVNSPAHYLIRNGYYVYDLRQDLAAKAQSAGVPHDQFSDWDRALEYILRCFWKDGAQDVRKAQWYMERLAQKLEAQDAPKSEPRPLRPGDVCCFADKLHRLGRRRSCLLQAIDADGEFSYLSGVHWWAYVQRLDDGAVFGPRGELVEVAQ